MRGGSLPPTNTSIWNQGSSNRLNSMFGVIEGDDSIVEKELRVGEIRLARVSVRKALDPAYGVVPGKTHGPPSQWRQARNR